MSETSTINKARASNSLEPNWMKKKVCIANAKINGLAKSPYFFEPRVYYVWDITFSKTSTLLFYNLPFIYMGNTYEEAEVFCNQVKQNFADAHIQNGDMVKVMYQKNGSVKAIGSMKTDIWIDVDDKFSKKTLEELNVIVLEKFIY